MMSQIPNINNINRAIIDILESISLEEKSISNILNAESERLKIVAQSYHVGNLCFSDLNKNCKNLNTTLVDVIMKEWLLLNKLNKVEDLVELSRNESHNSIMQSNYCNPSCANYNNCMEQRRCFEKK